MSYELFDAENYRCNTCDIIDPRNLLRYVVMNRSNVAIVGPPGSGKTALIKTVLKNAPKDYSVLVFDWYGEYADVCENYGRFSIDISDMDPMYMSNIIYDAITAKYGISFISSRRIEELIVNALESGVKPTELVDPRDGKIVHHIVSSLEHLYEGPRLDPKPGITCANLSEMDDLARSVYVPLALHMLMERRNMIYVIEDAYRFVRAYRTILDNLIEFGNKNAQYFLLTAHSFGDLWGLKGVIEAVIKFPAWGPTERYGALMKIYVMNSTLYRELPGHGVLRTYFVETGWPSAHVSK